jgi:hypothetical protein
MNGSTNAPTRTPTGSTAIWGKSHKLKGEGIPIRQANCGMFPLRNTQIRLNALIKLDAGRCTGWLPRDPHH